MKILAIRIKNLASLEGTTEIDFTAEPLHTAGIFAITGPTGAGKSTILDALCLALYGKTPRYIQAKETGVEIRDIGDNTMNQSDVRGILRDGTADGFAEVDFIGMDNQHYRATWNVKRARNKAEGRIGEATAVLLNIHTNQPFPGKKTETHKEIERLIGLSFEQFTRSVLLAQGDFTAFLKADKREKASLLEKLTGTDIYTHISRKIYERCKNEEIQLRDLENRKKDIRMLTEEELQTLTEEQAALQLNIEKTAQQIEGYNDEIVWHEQLVQLQNNEAAAYKLMDQANQTKAAAAEKELLLQQISQAQKAGIWIAALDAQTEQQARKRDTLNNCEVTIHALQEQKELLAAELDKGLKEFDDKSKAYSDALPLLHEARSLEILLEEKNTQLEKQEAEVLAVTRKGDEQQQTVQDKKQELESLSGTIEALKKWQDNNSERKPIATNSEFILAKLQDATKSLHALTAIENRKAACQKERTQNDFDKKTLRDELSIQQQQLEQSQKKYESESKALAQIPFSEISDEKEAIARTLNKATLAQAQWKLYYGSLKEINKLTQQLTENEATGKAKKIALDSIGEQLKTEEIKLETSKAFLDKARIAAAENVISLRDNLSDNEPCPVCGSKEHPYVTHNPNMEKLMDSFTQSYQEQEHLYLSLLKDHASLIQQYDGLQQTNLNLSEELASKRNTHDALQKEWTDIAGDIPDLASITDEQKADWLLDRSNELGKRQTALQSTITQYNERRTLLEKERIQLEETKSRTDAIDNQLKDKERKDSSLSETLANISAEETIRLTELNDVIDVLNPYFPVASWIDNWKKAPLPFAEHISSFATEWKEREENLLSLLQQYSIAEATLIGLEKQYKDIAADISEKRELLTTLQEQKKALALQRNALFEGAPVADVETRLKTAMEKAQVGINTIKETQHKLGNDETKALTQSEQIISDIALLEASIKTNTDKIQEWLNTYNDTASATLNITGLRTLLSYDEAWWMAEQEALHKIEQALIKATSVFSENRRLREAHALKQTSAKTLEEVSELNNQAKAHADNLKQQRNEIGFKLQQDEQDKKKIGSLLQEINLQSSVTEQWSKLNDIIGSADGKKFREIAQEYTLDMLLGYANIHLRALSNRYRIERIPSTLGMQVIDQDMGDDVRTVFSLSGGESFLVSLALALGLASLSSSKMKVESLFIDEGFGSLDPDTLNIAMDALERLHNQGRKVGVISHVQEMTERIPVQIRVRKMASGRSKVEVVG